ncbi:hypothetical protein CKO42_04940 [Lamprobacter modestohalophilus]|uniref:Uncharacterized protein n=1 Tax=Lamprobacter modestohalophilus TaxID=1064514 RepID=A0A9X0W6N6_9GAMM|nr:hypothetical protein [Lamprobacter modestohalophilus]
MRLTPLLLIQPYRMRLIHQRLSPLMPTLEARSDKIQRAGGNGRIGRHGMRAAQVRATRALRPPQRGSVALLRTQMRGQMCGQI